MLIAASYVMGLDLGQAGEPTGFAVLEWPATDVPTPDRPYHLRHLERFAPGVPYETIFATVAERASQPPLKGSPLVVDVTAVGTPVVDLLHKTLKRVIPIVMGAGHSFRWIDWMGQSVPKNEFVSRLQLAFQSRRLKIATNLADADVLQAELSAFRLRKVPLADTLDTEWRVGRNDDLVFAVALVCWHADQYPPRKPLPPSPPRQPRNPIERLMSRRPNARRRLFGS
jgi:hypothetical protein